MPTMQPGKENNPDIAIIGGGASGLAAACALASTGRGVVLFEQQGKCGRKLLATGNGRCNIWHTGAPVIFGDAAFATALFRHTGLVQVQAFFEGLGLSIRVDEAGRAYPRSNQAASVLDCLLAFLAQHQNVKIHTDSPVLDVHRHQGGFRLMLPGGHHQDVGRLILASGSPAAPKLGGDGSILAALKTLGHQVLPFAPALCPLELDTRAMPGFRGLSGLRVAARLSLYHDGQPVDASSGEAQFTDYGLSGLCAMQLARSAGEGLQAGRQVHVGLDVSPLLGLAEPRMERLDPAWQDLAASRSAVLKLLQERQQSLGTQRLYIGLLPLQLARFLAGKTLQEAASLLCDLRLPLKALRGYDQAQVARGGLCCQSFDPSTCQSTIVPGLYACGEALNIDGDTGGHNLLFAWASGLTAGRHCR